MEIEKKFLIPTLPFPLEDFPSSQLQQGYISVAPVIRIRQIDTEFFLTCKGNGLLQREEFELPIDAPTYAHLSSKLDFPFLLKRRYRIPYHVHTIELDIFEGCLEGLILAEVEFNSLEDARLFVPPDWFGKEVTNNPDFQNNHLCQHTSLNHLTLSPNKKDLK